MKVITNRDCLSIGLAFDATRFTRHTIITLGLRGTRGSWLCLIVLGADPMQEFLMEAFYVFKDLAGKRSFRLNTNVLG